MHPIPVTTMNEQPRALFSFDYQIKLEFDRTTIVPCLVSVYKSETLPKDTIKVGFFGGAGEPDLSGRTNIGVSDMSLDFARRTGRYIAYHNQNTNPKILPITGAAPGNPHAFAEAVSEIDLWPIGLSPFYDEEHHLDNGSQTNAYSAIIYLGQDREANFGTARGLERMNVQFALRDVYNILAVHVGIYAGGSRGTLQELVNNLHLNKDVALAKGTGGVSEHYPEFDEKIRKDTGSRIITTDNPAYAVKKLIELQLQKEKANCKRQRLFVDDIVERINEEIEKKKIIVS
jgi:hypothetical protein